MGGTGVSVGLGVFVGGGEVSVGTGVFVGISIVVVVPWVIASPSSMLGETTAPLLHPARIIIAKKMGKVLFLKLISLRVLFIFSSSKWLWFSFIIKYSTQKNLPKLEV